MFNVVFLKTASAQLNLSVVITSSLHVMVAFQLLKVQFWKIEIDFVTI